MKKRKIVQDYELSEDYWKKIEPLLPVPKPIRNGNYQAYLRACGWLVLLSMISKKD